ncbi:MAG: XRE family transcriptional regulator [Acidimicrobiia bacterium]|nr:XRE family transcriptional regulator [Acidimicrobiia bacterium]
MASRQPAEAVHAHVADIGQRLREARKGRFTVKELAAAAGVSAGLISEVERGQGNPSFRTLYRISQALGIRVGDLLSGDGRSKQAAALLVKRKERKLLQLGEQGLAWQLLTPNLQGKLEVLKTSVPPGFTNKEAPFEHEGEECVYLLSGESLEITVDDELFTLEEGDAITYDSGKSHWYHNPTRTNAVVLGVVTPPSF